MRIETLTIANSSGENVNPSTDETILLLRRMVKMMESNAVVDANMRQRVSVDNTVATLPNTYGLGAAGTNYPTVLNPQATTTVYYQPTWAGPIDPRWTNLEQARISYNTGIRNNLLFT